MIEALSMDGKGLYIWSSVGLSVIVMMAIMMVNLQRRKKIIANLKKQS